MSKAAWKAATLGSVTLLLAGALTLPRPAHAWGARGHELVATIGAKLATRGQAFWSANQAAMGTLTNVPDNTWKTGSSAATERLIHWFEPDHYVDDPARFGEIPHAYSAATRKYGEPVVRQNGTAPWRIQQLYDLAVGALKANQAVQALQMAGTMSHYVGDLSQPLHVTKNYDGQETGDPGIHSYFESTNIAKADQAQLVADVTAAAQRLLADPRFVAAVSVQPLEAGFSEVWRSYPFAATVIRNDQQLGRTAAGARAQLALAVDRLADGAATLAVILGRLWTEAGNPAAAVTASVPTPAWVAPQYPKAKSKRGWRADDWAAVEALFDDDCAREE